MTTELALPKEEVLAQARSLTVQTYDQATQAQQLLDLIKTGIREMERLFDTTAAHAAWQAACKRKKEQLAPWLEAEKLVKDSILNWQRSEEEARLEQQRILQQAATKAAEMERERLAKKAAKAVRPETKERYQEQAAQILAPVISVPEGPKLNGVMTKRTWVAEVVDANLVPRMFLEVNLKALNQYARNMKQGASVPGVRFREVESLAHTNH
jgi:hypothetical protein